MGTLRGAAGSCHAGRVSQSETVRPPKPYRSLDHALVAGVAAGLSVYVRVPVWALRAGFVLASFWKLSGAVAYGVLWLIMAAETRPVPIGLVAAARQGLRTVARRRRWRLLAGWAVCLGLGVVIAWTMSLWDHSVPGQYGLLGCVAGLGVGLVWLSRDLRWPRGGKLALIVTGGLLFWATAIVAQARLLVWVDAERDWWRDSMAVSEQGEVYASAVFIGATTLIAGLIAVLPWFLHPAVSSEEKQLELIAETRADMAAHLHDSVLQTLAVIQKRAGDPKTVAHLARRQEKELREWLYGEQMEDESATTALKEVIAELEASYPVAVELVTVGDHEMTVEIDAIVRAAREAILNAAKHSQAEKVDVYAEISDRKAEAFVRDRGRGFAVEDIGEDRMGIRGSIIDRMARFGGKVDIRSTVGEGTEIHLLMPLSEEGASHG